MTRLRKKAVILLLLIVGGPYSSFGFLSNVADVSQAEPAFNIELVEEPNYPNPAAPAFGIGGSGGGI